MVAVLLVEDDATIRTALTRALRDHGHAVTALGSGLPALSPENWSRVAQLAAPLALIIYAESWGSMRTCALPTLRSVVRRGWASSTSLLR